MKTSHGPFPSTPSATKAMSKGEASSIKVLKDDPEKKEENVGEKKEVKETDKKDSKQAEDELSAEDEKLKETLDLLVKTITESSDLPNHEEIQAQALQALRKEIRSSTSSMTSVPKPLKFLRPHYVPIQQFESNMPSGPNKSFLCDILSVMAMTMAATGSREALYFKLRGCTSDVGDWGHEFVRHLCGEIAAEWEIREDHSIGTHDLVLLVDQILPFKLAHNGEFEGIDLLIDINLVDRITEIASPDNFQRLCKYALACAEYLGDPEETENLRKVTFKIFLQFKAYSDALRVALKLDNKDLILDVFRAIGVKPSGADDEEADVLMEEVADVDNETQEADKKRNKHQLSYILASHRVFLKELETDTEIAEIMGNVSLNQRFLTLAQELDVKAAKHPDDIYKTHLIEGHGATRRRQPRADGKAAPVGPTHDSAKKNLADSFANAFLNCAFGQDLLVTPEGSDWVFKNRGHGMLSAAASVGLIHLWDVETGFNAVDKFSFSTHREIKAGGLLATGIISAGITSDMDAALGLLSEHVELDAKDALMKAAAVLGLGIAYAASAREDVMEVLTPLICEDSQTFEVVSLTCLSLGLVCMGTANGDVSESLIESFVDRKQEDFKDPMARLMCLGMGLLFLGQGEKCEPSLQAARASLTNCELVPYLEMTVKTCAYAGTGSVVEIQHLLSALRLLFCLLFSLLLFWFQSL